MVVAKASEALKPGDTVAGKYTIEATLGVGGMGIVYRALHGRLSQQVAIKMLLPSMLAHPTFVTRFEREARAAGQLRSRHTVRVIDVGEVENVGPYMVMELLQGQDLGTELEQRGPLPIGEAVEWVVQACAAMAEAHERGIIHRDLKPANLFISEEEEGRVLKVLDFGISKVEDTAGSSVTSTQATMGTPLYMSPEQVRSTKQVDQRTDIWSLGVILYELLTGRTPFTGGAAAVGAAIVSEDVPAVTDLRKDVPEELAAAVARALAKKRDDRYPDARSLSVAIAPWSHRTLPSSASKLVRASDPRLMARTSDSMRAATMAVEDIGPAISHAASMPGMPGAKKAITDAGWTASSTAPKKKRTGLIVAGGLGVVVVVGAIVGLATRPPSTPTTGQPPPEASAASAAPPAPSNAETTSAIAAATATSAARGGPAPVPAASGGPNGGAASARRPPPPSGQPKPSALPPPTTPPTAHPPPVVRPPPAGENPNRL